MQKTANNEYEIIQLVEIYAIEDILILAKIARNAVFVICFTLIVIGSVTIL